MAIDRTANLFGALSQVIADRTSDAVGVAAPSDSAAAALSALAQFLDRPTIDRLRQVLGLTSSGTVRLVDRLVAMGHVVRHPGPDGRSTALELTTSGRQAADAVIDARAGVLAEALAPLTARERETLDGLLGKVLTGMIRPPGAVRWICRMCDLTACGRAEGDCPVANEALARYA